LRRSFSSTEPPLLSTKHILLNSIKKGGYMTSELKILDLVIQRERQNAQEMSEKLVQANKTVSEALEMASVLLTSLSGSCPAEMYEWEHPDGCDNFCSTNTDLCIPLCWSRFCEELSKKEEYQYTSIDEQLRTWENWLKKYNDNLYLKQATEFAKER
jgi:hypothetical protein